MSYCFGLGLDEYTAEQIEAELALRCKRLAAGRCDYCDRPGTDRPCRFEDRHMAARRALEEQRAAFIRSVENTPREM